MKCPNILRRQFGTKGCPNSPSTNTRLPLYLFSLPCVLLFLSPSPSFHFANWCIILSPLCDTISHCNEQLLLVFLLSSSFLFLLLFFSFFLFPLSFRFPSFSSLLYFISPTGAECCRLDPSLRRPWADK